MVVRDGNSFPPPLVTLRGVRLVSKSEGGDVIQTVGSLEQRVCPEYCGGRASIERRLSTNVCPFLLGTPHTVSQLLGAVVMAGGSGNPVVETCGN